MKTTLSKALREDILKTVQSAFEKHRTVNVPALAEEVRSRHTLENVAFEDIQYELFQTAQFLYAPIEFDSGAVISHGRPPIRGDHGAISMSDTEH
jgi:hypothetical protein